ncbi:MAG: M56 family metallopeptidase [Dethiobacteria bacterium]|jgi:beta-lactamase regulating signal transducer with metallopeptidase domain
MSELFLSVLNMSLTASYVILFVIIVRLLLKKAPKFISYALWGVVAFRLIVPFSFESIFSLMPRNTNAVPIPHDIIYQQSPKINSGIEVVDSFVSQSLPAPTAGASANPLQIYVEIGAYIWALGIVALIVYSLVSVLILKRQLKSAQLIEQNIFEAKNLKTPFVLGLIRPKIYLPVGLKGEERSYILLHEQTHIHRKDHIIKILAFFILSIHWFNPLVWIAFILMSTDMELSCDEKVLKEMNEDIKKPYANLLLSLATGKHVLNGSPLAFGEGNVKGRIKNVLNYKKPRFWIIVISIIVVTVVGIGLMANPKTVTLITATGDFSLESLDRVTFGTLTSGNRVMNFSTAKAIEITDFIKELQVNKKEVSSVRGEGRDSTNQIHFAFEGFGNDGTIYDIYFNFNANFTEVWVDNGVKPSLSYKVKNPNGVKAFFERQFGSITTVMEIGSAEELWEARTKYIGDNSAVGKLIGLLPIPEGLQFDHFKLHTSVRPYVVEIVYSTSTETLKHYDKEEKYIANSFGNNALLLLALIDNADQISTSITDGKLKKGFINVREWADDTVGRDVRDYAESPEKLQELMDFSFTRNIHVL